MTPDVEFFFFSEDEDGAVNLKQPGWDQLRDGEATGQEVTIKKGGRTVFRKPSQDECKDKHGEWRCRSPM